LAFPTQQLIGESDCVVAAEIYLRIRDWSITASAATPHGSRLFVFDRGLGADSESLAVVELERMVQCDQFFAH
jgi:hypothetical protein